MIMKKTYTTPTMEIEQTELSQMMALSEFPDKPAVGGGGEGGDALTHEDKDWNIWNED